MYLYHFLKHCSCGLCNEYLNALNMKSDDGTIYGPNGILFSTSARNLVTIKAHEKSNRHMAIIQWLKRNAASDLTGDDYAYGIIHTAHGSSGQVPFPYLVTSRMIRTSYTEVNIQNDCSYFILFNNSLHFRLN